MTTERVLKDIPLSDVQMVIEDFKSEDCTDVKAEEQPDGRFTVRAMCPN